MDEQVVDMTDTETEGHDVEHEELLDGQTVFKGPRKIRKNLLNGDKADSD